MALSKNKKSDVIAEVSSLLAASKMTVVAEYRGTTVKALQTLRKEAKQNSTRAMVVKNRLVIKALGESAAHKDMDTSALSGQLLYAFNADDEVAPAQVLAAFAKTNPTIQFVGAISADGTFLSADDVKALAALPSKNQMIAGVINTLNGPVNGVMSGLGGNLGGILKALEAKAA